MDRSTGRVVVPFSGCAAPSLHPCWRCRVGERSLAIEGRVREREIESRGEDRRGEREEETLGRRVHRQPNPVNQPPGFGGDVEACGDLLHCKK